MGEASFKAGAKAMFDALQMRIANNWHPRFEKVCAAENNWAHEWALDALDEVSPEHVATWRSLDSMYAEGVEAGKRMRPPLPDNAGDKRGEAVACTVGLDANTKKGMKMKAPSELMSDKYCGPSKLIPLGQIRNEDGFRFIGIDKDGGGHFCIVRRGDSNSFYMNSNTALFSDLIGWIPDAQASNAEITVWKAFGAIT